MCPLGSVQIQTSVHAGGITNALIRSVRRGSVKLAAVRAQVGETAAGTRARR
jgi:hypothetical protein